jgi:hypothetical protein
MTDRYPYRIVTATEDRTLIWLPGKSDGPNELVVDHLGRLLAFRDCKSLQDYCHRKGWELTSEDEATLDLGAVHGWVEQFDLRMVPAGLVLEAWNFLEDLSHSLAGKALPAQGAIHDSAYEKIFGGEALELIAPEGAWTDEETAAVRELLRAGLHLWEEAVRGSGTGIPGSAHEESKADRFRERSTRKGSAG